MTQLLSTASFLLQAAGDSASTRIVVEHGWLANVASAGQALVSILVAIMLLMIVLMLFALKRSLDELTKLVKESYDPVRAMIGEARDVTSEVRKLAMSVQAPVARILETVDDAGERVRGAIVRAEERLERLDELAGIVQDEAEGFVVKSASLARGVRVGGAALRAALLGGDNGKRKRPPRRRAERGRDAREHRLEPAEGTSRDGVGPHIRPRALPTP